MRGQIILLPPRPEACKDEAADLLEGAIELLHRSVNGSARTVGECKSAMRSARDLAKEALDLLYRAKFHEGGRP